MSYNSDALQLLHQYMEKLDRKETKSLLLMGQQWGKVTKNLEGLVTDLSALEDLTPNQLYKLDLYRSFLVESKKQLNSFSDSSADIISDNQKVFGKVGIELTQEQIGLVKVRFNHLNPDIVNNMIGLTSDGTKLSDLLKESYPVTMGRIKDTLVQSIAMGRNPLTTASLIKDDMDGNLRRARTICRTESLRVERETSSQQMIASGVVAEKERWEAPDCCPDCDEVNGDRYELDADFDTHPNCRGCWLPIVE